jgi:hypothetical protein
VPGGSGRRPELCARVRRGEGAGGVTSGLGGFGRCSWSLGSAQTGGNRGGQGTSTVAAMGGGGGGARHGGLAGAAARGPAPPFKRPAQLPRASGPTGRGLGRRAAGRRQRTAGPSRGSHGSPVLKAFPSPKASGGVPRPWEGTACLGNTRWRPRRRGSGSPWRGIAAWPRSGACLIRTDHVRARVSPKN